MPVQWLELTEHTVGAGLALINISLPGAPDRVVLAGVDAPANQIPQSGLKPQNQIVLSTGVASLVAGFQRASGSNSRRALAQVIVSKVSTIYLACQILFFAELFSSINRVYSESVRGYIFKSDGLKNSSSVSARQSTVGVPVYPMVPEQLSLSLW